MHAPGVNLPDIFLLRDDDHGGVVQDPGGSTDRTEYKVEVYHFT